MVDINNKKVDNITNNLASQSLVIKSLWEESTTYGTKIWQNTITFFPKNIFSFVNHYISNTLPTSKIILLWGKVSNSLCKFCLDTQTLQHMVSGCKTALSELRYNWRQNSIIANLMKELKKLTKNTTGFTFRYCWLQVTNKNHWTFTTTQHCYCWRKKIYVIELTVGFEMRITINAERKKRNFE